MATDADGMTRDAPKVDHLRTTERERLRALVAADLAVAVRLHTDNFQLINPSGGILSKEQCLAEIATEIILCPSGVYPSLMSGSPLRLRQERFIFPFSCHLYRHSLDPFRTVLPR